MEIKILTFWAFITSMVINHSYTKDHKKHEYKITNQKKIENLIISLISWLVKYKVELGIF